MNKNILQILEKTTEKYPNKIAYSDKNRDVSYLQFTDNSKRIGSYLINKSNRVMNKAIVIFIDKTVNCLETMMGTVYSGNFYAVIDVNSPKERTENIINTLNPIAIITDNKNKGKLEKSQVNVSDINIFIYEEMVEGNVLEDELEIIRNKQIDTDVMYVLFTSGSTGIPKGAILSHRAVISYINWVKDTFNINENTVFGSQTPFYFSMSITDVFTSMLVGGTMHIIPKMNFSFPVELIKYLNDKKINTIYWVPSALCIVANLGALNDIKLPYLKKILFAGEVMPVKQLNMWMKAIPNCLYANLYGPTETTDICTYYIVNRKFNDNETLPIGKHCDNCDVIVIKEDGTEAKKGEQGELCVRGSFLAYGYYANQKKTQEVFIQNPLNKEYPEIVYKTGDIVKYNDNDELLYISRKDYQIKHMGYRIELGEIEKNIYTVPEIILCACIYDDINSNIILYYQGNIDENQLAKKLDKLLLPYMKPNKYINIPSMPYNSNGKIDRKKLKNMYMENKK